MKNKFNRIYHQIISYMSTNRLFLSYVIISLIGTILLRKYTIGNTFDIRPVIVDLALILIFGSLGYLIKPSKQYLYFMSLILIYTTICVVNSVYYTFYMSFSSISLLASLGQAGEVGDSIIEKLQYFHFIFLLMPIIFYFINKNLRKLNYYSYIAKIEKGKKMMSKTIMVGGICIAFSACLLTRSSVGALTKQWNREFVVERFGVILYQGNDLIQSLTPKINTLFGYDAAAKNFREYYATRKNVTNNNEFTNLFEGKNIIFVHMESVQSFALDTKINGKEITPNLNQLKKESIYFNNFYPQIGVGTSSDTEFTNLTSLMPALSGTVFVSYTNRTYETTLKLLKEKNYYTFSMHGNKANMWNRSIMYPALGYDNFYSKSSYTVDETIGLGLSDKSFYRQIIPILEEIEITKNNYVGTIISLSNHSPFDDLEKYGEFDLTANVKRLNERTGELENISDTYLENSKLGNYLKSLHYADEALGDFLNYIENSSYFNNTIFIFYGDHDARLSKSEFDNFYNYDLETGKLYDENDSRYYNYDYYQQQLNRKTPLIIWSKSKEYIAEYNYPMGMIDILPTLANMMNFKCTYCLGNDIFSIKDNNTVIFTNGNFLTNNVYYNNAKTEYISLSTNPIDENYIINHKAYTDEILKLSNDIIVYDLIAKENNNLLTYKEENK